MDDCPRQNPAYGSLTQRPASAGLWYFRLLERRDRHLGNLRLQPGEASHERGREMLGHRVQGGQPELLHVGATSDGILGLGDHGGGEAAVLDEHLHLLSANGSAQTSCLCPVLHLAEAPKLKRAGKRAHITGGVLEGSVAARHGDRAVRATCLMAGCAHGDGPDEINEHACHPGAREKVHP